MGACDWYLEQINAYLDGGLSAEETEKLLEHLAVCGDCRAYLADETAIREAFSTLESPVPEGFTARIMERVRAEERDAPKAARKVVAFPGWRRWAALAACCAVVCLGVWRVGLAGGQDRVDSAVGMGAADTAVAPAEEEAAVRTRGAGPAADGGPENAKEMDSAEDALSMEPAAAPAAHSDGEAAECGGEAAGGEQAALTAADKGRTVAYARTLTAAGPAAQAWVARELGRVWEPGTLYPLTEEQYAALAALLTEAGEAFEETAGEEGWSLLAGAAESE